MIDLTNWKNSKFVVSERDYKNAIDLGVDGQSLNDERLRAHLVRLNKSDIPALIEVLQKQVENTGETDEDFLKGSAWEVTIRLSRSDAEAMSGTLTWLHDEGPEQEGWQSPELIRLTKAINKALGKDGD